MFNRIRRIDLILIQATIAAALSFAHLHDIAEAAGQGGWKAWAYPVSVDLLMIMAWKRIRTPDVPKRAAWFWFLLSLAASLGANTATAGVLDMEAMPVQLRVIVAGWPALAFLGGSLLVHSRPKDDADEQREAPAQEPQATAEEPPVPPAAQLPGQSVNGAQKPHLVTYAEAATALGVAEATVRGAANNDRLKKYAGPVAGRVLVDLREARSVLKPRKLVSAP
jgi:hypothetical protein